MFFDLINGKTDDMLLLYLLHGHTLVGWWCLMAYQSYELFNAKSFTYIYESYGGAHGVMVIVVGNGRGDTSSNIGRDWLHFT